MYYKSLIETLKDEDKENRITPIMLALIVGMRRGEIAGLQYRDIDFEKRS